MAALLAAGAAQAQQNPPFHIGGSSLVEGGAAGVSTVESFSAQSLQIVGINGVSCQFLYADNTGNIHGIGNCNQGSSGGGGGSGTLIISNTPVQGAGNGAILFNSNNVLGAVAPSGTGNVLLSNSAQATNFTLTNPLIGNGVISGSNLAVGAALANIGNGGITSAFLAPGAALGNLANGSIGSALLASGAAIGNIGPGTIGSGLLSTGAAVGNLAPGSITNPLLANPNFVLGGSTVTLGNSVGTSGTPVAGTLFVTGLTVSGTCTGCSGAATSVSIGSTGILGGTSGNVEVNNAGKFGEVPDTITVGGSTFALGGAIGNSSGTPIAGTLFGTNLSLSGAATIPTLNITTALNATGLVTGADLASGAAAANLGPGGVTSSLLASGAAAANLGPGGVTSSLLAPGSALANIGNGDITSTYLATGAALGNLAAGSIGNNLLTNPSFTLGGSLVNLGNTIGVSGTPVTGTLYVTGLNVSGTCTGCSGAATNIGVGSTTLTNNTPGDILYDNNGIVGEFANSLTFGGSIVGLPAVLGTSGSPVLGTSVFTNLTVNSTSTFTGTTNLNGPVVNGGNAITFPAQSATLAGINVPETFSAAQSFAEVHGTAYAPTLTSNNYSAAISDCGQTLKLPTGTSPTVTLPNINPATAECTVKMVQTTSVAYTIQAASGGSVVSGSGCTGITTARQYAQIIATLFTPSASAAVWDVSGDCQ